MLFVKLGLIIIITQTSVSPKASVSLNITKPFSVKSPYSVAVFTSSWQKTSLLIMLPLKSVNKTHPFQIFDDSKVGLVAEYDSFSSPVPPNKYTPSSETFIPYNSFLIYSKS